MCIQLYKLQAIENRSLQLQTFDPYYIRKQVLLDFYLSHPPICCRNSFFVSLADTFFFPHAMSLFHPPKQYKKNIELSWSNLLMLLVLFISIYLYCVIES